MRRDSTPATGTRRKYLTYGAAVLTGGLAGCAGGRSSGARRRVDRLAGMQAPGREALLGWVV